MKKLLLGALAALTLILTPSCYRVARAIADQAPAICWNLRTASYNTSVIAWNTGMLTYNTAAAAFAGVQASQDIAKTAHQVADPRTGAAAQLRKTTAALVDVPDKVLGEVRALREVGDRRMGDVLTRTDNILDLTRTTEQDVKQFAATTTAKLDGPLAAATESILEIRTNLTPTLMHATNIVKQVDDTAPLFLDCDHNPDCIFNRYQGTSKAFEGIAIDVHKVTSKFTAPRSFKAKVWDALTMGIFAGAKAVH